jgi:hypothetical protein
MIFFTSTLSILASGQIQMSFADSVTALTVAGEWSQLAQALHKDHLLAARDRLPDLLRALDPSQYTYAHVLIVYVSKLQWI